MSTIEFESSRFAPYLPETCQVNPGVYGFELALWLSQSLMARGVVTSYPAGEDWGWFIEYIDGDETLMIGCSSTADEGVGIAGGAIACTVAVSAHRGWRRRSHGRPSMAIERVRGEIVRLLEDEGITLTIHDY